MFSLSLRCLAFLAVLVGLIYCGSVESSRRSGIAGIPGIPDTPANVTHHVARYPDGSIFSEYDLDSDNFVHGRMIEYHRNGEISVIQEFEHGVAVGVSEHFDESGQPID